MPLGWQIRKVRNPVIRGEALGEPSERVSANEVNAERSEDKGLILNGVTRTA